MRQRANIIRTLACKPEVVLMDEPFGALDAQTRVALQQLLIDIWAEQRPTICFVTHDVEESILLGDRVVMLGARPGTVRAIYPVDIPHPRDVVALKSDPRFQAIHRELWADLGSRLSTHVLRPGRAA
jgi:NitT/TauT family transport system ATP-binding protein